jgi:hypothetical protein
MAIAKAVTGNDIINGLAIVALGAAKPAIYDPVARVQDYPSGDSLRVLQNIDSRYLYHGGVGGSGAWEH